MAILGKDPAFKRGRHLTGTCVGFKLRNWQHAKSNVTYHQSRPCRTTLVEVCHRVIAHQRQRPHEECSRLHP